MATAPSISESLSGLENPLFSQGLALVATTLLVFVSIGIIYLSVIEWRDRRRRKR